MGQKFPYFEYEGSTRICATKREDNPSSVRFARGPFYYTNRSVLSSNTETGSSSRMIESNGLLDRNVSEIRNEGNRTIEGSTLNRRVRKSAEFREIIARGSRLDMPGFFPNIHNRRVLNIRQYSNDRK